MKKHLGWAAAACAACLFVAWLWRPQEARSQSGVDGMMQFRVVVGLTDLEAKEFRGKVTVTGGEVVSMKGWRFSQQDRAGDNGEFQFTTKIGNLENQLRQGELYGQTGWNDPNIRRLIPQGVIVRVRATAQSRVKFESAAGTFEYPAARAPYAALGGNARVDWMPMEEKISAEGRADDYPAVTMGPNGERWVAWLSYKDQADEVVVSDGTTVRTVSAGGDHHGPAIAHDGKGTIHVVWARRYDNEFHLVGTVHAEGKWGRTTRLASTGGSHFAPALASDGAGRLALVWQCLRGGRSRILMRIWDGDNWGTEQQVNTDEGNAWTPAAGFGGGKLWVAWDSYTTGSYQIYARSYTGEQAAPAARVTVGENFSVRPTVAVTAQGAPVIAWEESDAAWGKDFTFLLDRRGTTLYKNRRIRVAWLDGGSWKETARGVEEALPAEIRRFMQQPQLALRNGSLYLAFRARTAAGNARRDFWASNGKWESYLTRFSGERWEPAVLLPSSIGRNGMKAAVALGRDAVHVVWPTDNRTWQANTHGDLDIYAARLPLESGSLNWRGGRGLSASKAPGENAHRSETADTARIRNYRIEVNGRRYRILRGDLHRHTELSGDGAGEGMLEDLYRYAMDAAAMDYGHVGDHQMGDDQEYNWWITQKSNDLYHLPQRFVAMYGYERSVPFPNGHRNVVWAERGKPVMPIGPAERMGGADTGPILFPYLRKTDGIATSHTSATQQGTDWRDNDPDVEPIVEIYQGFESSYEHGGAPRAWKEGESPVHQGLKPEGYIWNAWAKGYKLGVQSSSDHVSTHSSYACIVVEEFTRQGLLDAMRKRHTYAATDQIVMDYRITGKEVGALMGDVVEIGEAPKLAVRIVGTAPIKQVDVIKNNVYIHKLTPNQQDVSFEYLDAASASGESYYYVRAEQTDGQLAWSSPIWVRRK
ncbi:MAG: hypothetical protein FJW20_21700 [Acidimicrobiia bacterium]|nr:hypothetical protein [Acidimicrobiia bacterium]